MRSEDFQCIQIAVRALYAAAYGLFPRNPPRTQGKNDISAKLYLRLSAVSRHAARRIRRKVLQMMTERRDASSLAELVELVYLGGIRMVERAFGTEKRRGVESKAPRPLDSSNFFCRAFHAETLDAECGGVAAAARLRLDALTVNACGGQGHRSPGFNPADMPDGVRPLSGRLSSMRRPHGPDRLNLLQSAELAATIKPSVAATRLCARQASPGVCLLRSPRLPWLPSVPTPVPSLGPSSGEAGDRRPATT